MVSWHGRSKIIKKRKHLYKVKIAKVDKLAKTFNHHSSLNQLLREHRDPLGLGRKGSGLTGTVGNANGHVRRARLRLRRRSRLGRALGRNTLVGAVRVHVDGLRVLRLALELLLLLLLGLARELRGDLGLVGVVLDLDGRVVGLEGDHLLAAAAVPLGLFEPVQHAGKGRETDADKAEKGSGKELHALALAADLSPGALVAELAVDPFGVGAEVLQQCDLVGVASVHASLGHGLHLDGLAGLGLTSSIARLLVGGRESFSCGRGHFDGFVMIRSCGFGGVSMDRVEVE
jgi:hypothetical protein